MSDLLAMYIDMELKASRKSKEDHNRICTRLTSCLYVYLGMYYFRYYLYINLFNNIDNDKSFLLRRTFHRAFVRYFDKNTIYVPGLSSYFRSDNNVSILY